MTKMPDLLPCPFCRGKPQEWFSGESASVVCSICGAAITRFIIIPNYMKVLREAWNRRDPDGQTNDPSEAQR